MMATSQRSYNCSENRGQENEDSFAAVQPVVTAARSRNMSRIRGKDTKPEMIVRRYLWAHGFRYRLNHPRLPGKPDIVLRKYRTCVFVNGCFWHGHGLPLVEVKSEKLKVKNWAVALDGITDSECCKVPKTNREFWVRKIIRNKERDIEVQRKLAEMGWHCITVWECSLSPALSKGEGGKSQRERTLESLAYTLNKIYLQDHAIQHKVKAYSMPEEDGLAMAAEVLHNDKE